VALPATPDHDKRAVIAAGGTSEIAMPAAWRRYWASRSKLPA
jgi:hypothetical protein